MRPSYMSYSEKVVTHSCYCGLSFTSIGNRYPTLEAEAAGFKSAMAAWDGLTIKWICPSCFDACQHALKTLISVLGPEAKYVSFTELMTELEKAGTRG